MNLLHLSNADITGGAAQATYQLHTLLRDAGHRSVLAVRRKDSSDSDVIQVGTQLLRTCSWAERIERVRARLAGGYRVTPLPYHYFNRNLAPVPDWDATLKFMPKPDVLFLHWITHLLTAGDIRRLAERVACPIVWVLMDMEPMTGGCHYAGDCTRFHKECRECPQLQARGGADWAHRIWREKVRHLSDLPITFLASTRWLADRLAVSGLFSGFPVVQIPLPMNTRIRPLKKSVAREILGLPMDKKIILVGSHNLQDPRKGMDHLIRAVQFLAEQGEVGETQLLKEDKALFLLMGKKGAELSQKLPFPSQCMGYVHSQIELTLAYQAADLFASPSLEDAGPMMLSQAMLCGTPVVAFDTGIASELITSGENGYVARLGDVEDFACGIKVILADDGSAGRRATEVASCHHDSQRIAHAYGEMLETLVSRSLESVVP